MNSSSIVVLRLYSISEQEYQNIEIYIMLREIIIRYISQHMVIDCQIVICKESCYEECYIQRPAHCQKENCIS